MATITYTAQRKLVSGHTAGTEYTFEHPLADLQPSIDDDKTEVMSLSGRQFTTLRRIDYDHGLVFMDTNDADVIAQMDEWLNSVAGGEEFTIDFTGTQASPVDPVQVKKVGKHGKQLVDTVGYYSYSVTVREVV